jgi:Flp pilus assembly protein TadG
MIRLIRRPTERRRGAAIVEAALVLPIFFMVVLGIVEFGRAFMISQMLQNCAREGCRKAVTGAYSTSTVAADIKSDLQVAGVKAADVTVTITVTVEPGNPAVANNEVSSATTKDLVNVTVSVPFSKIALIPGKYLGSKTLTGRSAMRHE